MKSHQVSSYQLLLQKSYPEKTRGGPNQPPHRSVFLQLHQNEFHVARKTCTLLNFFVRVEDLGMQQKTKIMTWFTATFAMSGFTESVKKFPQKRLEKRIMIGNVRTK